MAKRRNIKYINTSPQDETAQHNLEIFNIMKELDSISIQQIEKASTLPSELVAGYINTCVKEDLLKISGSGKGDLVKFNASYRKILGIGFTSQKCLLTSLDLGGKVTAEEEIDMPLSTLKGTIKEIKEIISTIKASTKLAREVYSYIGIGLPDFVSIMGQRGIDVLAQGLSNLFNASVVLAKETTASGYGEIDLLKSTGRKEVLYIHQDIGSGVIVKGEAIFEAGLESKSPDKTYLRPWDQFDIVSTAKSVVDKGIGTSIVDIAGGAIDKITLDVVLNAAREHDGVAEDLVKRSGYALGVRVAYLVNMFNVAVVILGGGVEKKEGGFIQFVEKGAEKFFVKGLSGKVRILPGKLAGSASSIGAALLARRELYMEVKQ